MDDDIEFESNEKTLFLLDESSIELENQGRAINNELENT